ncbi:Transcriptional activator DEMETER [Artemisia annua]|uniref:Transcriptional activator DEMETER n=1 Tax=Artemisia annua TaxID=35608 RepID=A0A2U1NYJ0_ARTAN|nr:Transcriptional activator DEMETER [Artemisia annua]
MEPDRSTEHVVISVREDELDEAKAAPADPQYNLYFLIVFTMAGTFTILLNLLPIRLRENRSLFNEHGGLFTMMIIASISVTVLASAILILANYFFQTWMKNIYYTVLKTVGCFSAPLVPFSLGLVLFVPHNLSWIVYSIISVIFVLILVVYYVSWNLILACLIGAKARVNCDNNPGSCSVNAVHDASAFGFIAVNFGRVNDTGCARDESGVDMKESRKRRNNTLDMNKKKRSRTIKHTPKIYDNSKPNKVLNSQSPNSSNPAPKTPKTPKTVAPNRVQKKSQNSKHNNSTSYGFQSCKHSLDFDVGNSGEIATFKRNLPRSCRFQKRSLEASQNVLGDISETSNEEQAEENGKATALGEQEAAQYDTSGAQDEECEGLDINKKKRPRMRKHKPKIYDDSKANKVSKFQTSNSSTRTPVTPTTLKTTATPKPQNLVGKFDNSGKIATLKRNLPRRNCRYQKKSLETPQNLLGDISKTHNEGLAEENGQKYFHVYERHSNISSNAISLFIPAFELYQRRIKVNGRKDIHVYRRRSKSKKKENFLDRIYKEHGSLDLEWLRNVPPNKANFFGIDLKSVECVRLLTLHHLAFPVFCSKKKPNCKGCPMKAECLHYASAFPSSAIHKSPEDDFTGFHSKAH